MEERRSAWFIRVRVMSNTVGGGAGGSRVEVREWEGVEGRGNVCFIHVSDVSVTDGGRN